MASSQDVKIVVDGLPFAYLLVASFALVTYDYLLTFNRELLLMWRSPWSFVKVLFFFKRYAPFVAIPIALSITIFPLTISEETTCHALLIPSQWLLSLGLYSSEAIIFTRTWALWGRTKYIAIGLAMVFFLAITSMIVLGILWQNTVIFHVTAFGSESSRCLLVHDSNLVIVVLGIIVFLEILVLVLTVARMIQDSLSEQRTCRSRLVHVLYRDGIMFFTQILLLSTGNIVVSMVASLTSTGKISLIVLQLVIHSILSDRILFNLRETQYRDATLQSISDVVFVSSSRQRGE